LSVEGCRGVPRYGRIAVDMGHAAIISPGAIIASDWLAEVGLTPAKSLTLGPLTVPDENFADFFRGCLDGDGSIVTYIDRHHTVKSARYGCSGSQTFQGASP
jgi:hypothetical protein